MLPGYSDATMWGPQGDPNAERTRLKPGDRLADGTVYQGDDPEAVLLAQVELVQREMQPLQQRLNELLHKLTELYPEKYGPFIVGLVEQSAPTVELSNLAYMGLPSVVVSPIGENLAEPDPPDERADTAPSEVVTAPPVITKPKPASGAKRGQG